MEINPPNYSIVKVPQSVINTSKGDPDQIDSTPLIRHLYNDPKELEHHH